MIHPRLSRALYRSFLRASNHGERPELFGRHGAAVFAGQCQQNTEHASLALPSDAPQVRKRLKAWFRNPNGNRMNDAAVNELLEETTDSPLEVMRRVQEQARLLNTPLDDVTPLPVFDYELAALPGEQIQTLFLEPRYVHGLMPMLLESSSPLPSRFLLRHNTDAASATVLTLLSHQHVTLPANTVGLRQAAERGDSRRDDPRQRMISGVAVTCVAGQRVRIGREETIHGFSKELDLDDLRKAMQSGSSDGVNNPQKQCWSESEAPLAIATSFDLCHDTDSCISLQFEHTRLYILNLIECVLGYHDKDLGETLVHTGFGLPPLDPEGFSIWALRFVLSREDVDGRQFWLHNCHSTMERLQYVVIQIEAILDAQQEEDGNDEQVAEARFG